MGCLFSLTVAEVNYNVTAVQTEEKDQYLAVIMKSILLSSYS